jgi:hypothetical protein
VSARTNKIRTLNDVPEQRPHPRPETALLRLAVRRLVTDAYVRGLPAPSLEELAARTDSPLRSTANAVDALVSEGILAKTPGSHRSLRPVVAS